ncbi:hypothetical protein GE061_006390 [Apolygus lucorum]|uniref:Peptidase C1A papain C-terminal domain-containing protein n=1 Tax=Apolygus lucorum TaxID=248454 RepID=A0A6A4J583_APOLU|nr:hypothetical protein GE061_006390 [Apolygus lucorum]
MPFRTGCIFILSVVYIAVSAQRKIEFTEVELADYNKLNALVEKEGAKQEIKDFMKTDKWKYVFRSLRYYLYSSVEGYKANKRQFWLRLNQWSAYSDSFSYFGTHWDEEIQDEVEPVTEYDTVAEKKLQTAFLSLTSHNFSYHLVKPMPWNVNDTVIPREVDWRLRGTIDSPVNKYHYNCKASYPFAVASTIDAHLSYYSNPTTDNPTSPQLFLSCPYANDKKFKNYNPCKDDQYGANGTPDAIVRSYKFAVLNGIRSGWEYADGEGNGCLTDKDYFHRIIDGYVILPKGKKAEIDLMVAVALHGPVTVSFESSEQNFELLRYGGGIYDLPCAKGKMFSMVVIGYGEDNGKPYWLLMNNFGPEWGQYGYIKIARFSPTACDITQQMIFPVIFKTYPIFSAKDDYWTEYENNKMNKVLLFLRYNYTVGKELPPILKLPNEPSVWV